MVQNKIKKNKNKMKKDKKIIIGMAVDLEEVGGMTEEGGGGVCLKFKYEGGRGRIRAKKIKSKSKKH